MSYTLTNIDDYIVLKNSNAYKNVFEILDIIEDIEYDTATLKREFAWSYDDIVYSEYIELSDDNLINVPLLNKTDLWIKFRYRLLSGGPVTINSISLEITPDNENPLNKNIPLKNPTFDVYTSGNWNGNTFLDTFSFNPYNVNPAIKFAYNLSSVINKMFGINAEYFRAVPDTERGTDVVLREYNIHNVTESKCLKVLIPNNQTPDGQFIFNQFGIDFGGLPFEVHIDKKYFESIYGEGNYPQRKDILYFETMDRIYQVRDSYLQRSFMSEGLYYRVALEKWTPSPTSVQLSDDVKEYLSGLTRNTEMMLSDSEKIDTKSITNPDQLNKKTLKVDSLRRLIKTDLIIVEEDLNNGYNVLTNFSYDLSSKLPKSGDLISSQVEYTNVSWLNSDNKTFSCWFKDKRPVTKNKSIISLTRDNNELTIEVNYKFEVLENDYIKLNSTTSNLSIFGKVTSSDIINNNQYVRELIIEIPDIIIEYIDENFVGWDSLTYTIDKEWESRLFGSDDFRFSIWCNCWILIEFNNIQKLHYCIMDQNKWYALVYSRSNEFKQEELNIWKQNTDKNKSDLVNIYSKTESILNEYLDITQGYYSLYGSPIQLTNIRLLDTLILKDQQNLFLNQTIVKNAGTSVIIDNAVPEYRTPYMSKQP